MKKILLILVCATTMLGGQARTVRDFFVGEKGDLFAMLPTTARMDLLDYYDNGQLVAARNNLKGGSQLVSVEGDFLSITMSESKNVQMLLTSKGKDTVIVVIETFDTPVKDCSIQFYDAQWNEVKNPGKLFKMPALSDFVLPDAGKDVDEQLQALPFELISLSLEGEGHTTLVARHGLKQYLVPQEYQTLEKSLKPAIMYRLNGTQWKQMK